MLGFSFTEIIFLAVLALIVIGPKQLPEVARTLGRFLNDLKRSTESLKDEFKIKIDDDFETRKTQALADIKKQQEALKAQEIANPNPTPAPIADEDQQLSLQGLGPDQHKKENT